MIAQGNQATKKEKIYGSDLIRNISRQRVLLQIKYSTVIVENNAITVEEIKKPRKEEKQ